MDRKKSTQEKDLVLDVLYEDEHMIAYDKPSGVAVVEQRDQKDTGLLSHLRAQNENGPPYLVHRLDKGTSGVWVVAKTVEAKRDLTEQFAQQEVEKQYRAYIQGVLYKKEGLIEAPLGKHPKNPIAMAVSRKGRPAKTAYKCLYQFRRFAVVRAWPKTGRTHQIRVHLRHLGHPLIIDDLYGGLEGIFLSQMKPGYKKAKNREEKSLISRLTLHCESIELRVVGGETKIPITSPLPKDLRRLERNLRNYG